MLTRHLYEVDEVAAAISWCIKKRREIDTAFWVKELIDSEMTDELYSVLYSAWLWNVGIGRLDVLRVLYDLYHREEETGEDDLLAFAVTLARIHWGYHDSSVFTLLAFGAVDEYQWDRTVDVRVCINLGVTDLEKEFARACWTGKARLAWDLSRSLWQENKERTWLLVKEIQQLKYNSAVMNQCLEILEKEECDTSWASRACAVAAICLSREEAKYSIKPFQPSLMSSIDDQVNKWRGLEGRRKRRIFEIPRDCLYWATRRGRSTNEKKNLRKVYCGSVAGCSLQDIRGCPFWERVIQEETPEASEDHFQQFYATYFPDDIPDEWSLEDQQKSHGHGALIGSEVPNYRKYAEKWFRTVPSQVVWMGSMDAMRLLSKIDGIIEGWDKVYEKDFKAMMSDWDLTPAKKREFDVRD